MSTKRDMGFESGLILIRIWMSARSLPKCSGCISHFAKFRKNWPVTVRNLLKSPIPQWWRRRKIDPESTRGSGPTLKINHFQRVNPCPWLLCLVDVRYRNRELSCSQTEWQNERPHYPASLGGIIMDKYEVMWWHTIKVVKELALKIIEDYQLSDQVMEIDPCKRQSTDCQQLNLERCEVKLRLSWAVSA